MTNDPRHQASPYRVTLHANESFIPIPPALQDDLDQAYAACDIRYYPDPQASDLRQAAARHYGCRPDMVTVGNGSDEIIDLLLRTLCRPGDPILLMAPDFGVYRHAADLQGLEIHTLAKAPGQGLDLAAVLNELARTGAEVLLFSNPCNPTGALTSRASIQALLEKTRATILVDEAYMEFADASVLDLVAQEPRLVVLKTLSKAFGAAGLRIGFAISSPDIAQALDQTAPLYNVGRLNQALATCFFAHPQALVQAVQTIKRSTANLLQGLQDLAQAYPDRLTVYPTAANFIYMETDDAQDLYARLQAQGILIRCLGPKALRVSAGSPPDNRRFLDAFSDCLEEDAR